MVEGRTLSPGHFFAYGALYHELAALVSIPFSAAGDGERHVLIALRAVSLAGGAATLALTFALGARLFGPWAGLLAAGLTACSAELAVWSITAHPDTLQLALLTGGLLAACAVRDVPSRGRIVLAALLAGLAFGTKYAGVLLLPLLGFALIAAHLEAGCRGMGLVRRLMVDALIGAAVFGLTFALTNPYALIEWRRWLTQVRAEMLHAREGHVTLADEPRLRWLRIVADRSFAGVAVVLGAVAGAVTAALTPRPPLPILGKGEPNSTAVERVSPSPNTGRGGRGVRALSPPVLVAIWTFGYLAYLVAFVGLQEPRYALPALPGLAVLAAGSVAWIGAAWPRLGAVTGVALLLLTAAGALGPMRAMYSERSERTAVIATDPRMLAGRWLGEELNAGATVVSDAYVYLPRHLAAATTFGLTRADVAAQRPVAIVVNEQIRGRFRDPAGATRAVDGPAAYTERLTTYARLEAGELGCYRPVADFGEVRIYADGDALASRSAVGCGLDEPP
jgi:hypothetical protein